MNSVRCLLVLAVDQLNVKFAVARVDGVAIANDANAPLEAEAAIVEVLAEVISNCLGLLDTTGVSPADARLRDREEYFRVLTDNATDIIFIIGPDGILKYMSASPETILGYKVEERLGRPAFETVHPDDRERLSSLLNLFKSRRSLDRAQFRFRHKNESWRLLEIHGTNLLQHPLIGGLVINARDVTERRRLEQELEQLNRLSSLGRLAAQVAHEFNNVTMGIQPAVDILRRIGADNPQMGRLTDMIASSISRGKRITSDILRFGRPAQLSLRSLNVQELIEQSVAEIRALLPPAVTLAVVQPEIPLYVRGDHPQLVQVLVNLALNARDAMAAKGGTLTIRAHAGAGEQLVHIDVADTGEGILEAEGMTVHAIGCAAEVLPAVDAFKPDVVLLDLSRPDDDGRTVYEAISRKSVPVIFSTGSIGSRDLVESGHGGVSVLTKPYTSEDLLRAIYEAVPPGEVA